MDAEIAQLRAEVVQLRTEVGKADAKAGRLGSDVKRLTAQVTLLQTDMRQNDTSLVEMAVRVNQLDRRMAESERREPENGEREPQPAEVPGHPPGLAGATSSGPATPDTTVPALRYGMSQQEVLHMFGSPHAKERILDSIYWYYADGDLKGQYVRFDGTSGYVNGWSTFSPQHFQIELQTTREGHTR
jgi:hypothetical protein